MGVSAQCDVCGAKIADECAAEPVREAVGDTAIGRTLCAECLEKIHLDRSREGV